MTGIFDEDHSEAPRAARSTFHGVARGLPGAGNDSGDRHRRRYRPCNGAARHSSAGNCGPDRFALVASRSTSRVVLAVDGTITAAVLGLGAFGIVDAGVGYTDGWVEPAAHLYVHAAALWVYRYRALGALLLGGFVAAEFALAHQLAGDLLTLAFWRSVVVLLAIAGAALHPVRALVLRVQWQTDTVWQWQLHQEVVPSLEAGLRHWEAGDAARAKSSLAAASYILRRFLREPPETALPASDAPARVVEGCIRAHIERGRLAAPTVTIDFHPDADRVSLSAPAAQALTAFLDAALCNLTEHAASGTECRLRISLPDAKVVQVSVRDYQPGLPKLGPEGDGTRLVGRYVAEARGELLDRRVLVDPPGLWWAVRLPTRSRQP